MAKVYAEAADIKKAEDSLFWSRVNQVGRWTLLIKEFKISKFSISQLKVQRELQCYK
ncbi:MAG: hypothetical protein MRERC_1c215 [Mycoplasmataceae bacterium RC_NB112A]|nr:MAG: hypothetical protein MRERC_1c215 [Mycoplasmataceae bacterium RC_NB112A]